MAIAPVIHDERNRPTGLRFDADFVTIDLADARAIMLPLYFFPWLKAATDAERSRYQLGAWSVYWQDLDEAIDLIAMISGMYINDKARPAVDDPLEAPALA